MMQLGILGKWWNPG
uniref:Uncharacterized protein n=1 Tax=Lotus japonicus TaxID=34305 RepID=I3SF83_LOTJA|nr:unknown [Lotus japonicus]